MVVRVTWQRGKAEMSYPVPPAPRTAVLVPYFCPGGAVRVFPNGWTEEVENFAPEAIAATLQQLESLAGRRIASLTHAVIVLHRRGDSPLMDAAYERLWTAFRVPVFEQMVGKRGKLLAAECEAHCGLHVILPGFRLEEYRLDGSPCACGRISPRLVARELARHAAA